MKTNLLTRMLSLLVVAALVFGMVPAVGAAGQRSEVTFTQVDNSQVSVNPLDRIDEDLPAMNAYSDTDQVRVSIILEKPSTVKAGFSTEDVASNTAAIAYRDSLKQEQTTMIARIEKAIKADLDVAWSLTLAANLISANVRYGQIKTIEKLPGVKQVVIETQYVVDPAESSTVRPNMATSGAQTGSYLAWDAGYTGAGTRIAVIDTGIDTDHQAMSEAGFLYALSLLAEEAGMTNEEYVQSLDLLDAEEIAAVADELNVPVDPSAAYINTKLPFGYNYKDADYDVTHDNDEQGEHGSHVAGIATANSWIPAGDGSFAEALESTFVRGVAPEAQLLTMKVFGKNGSPYDSDYMAAIEDAVILGADAVNLSLGSVAPGRGAHDNPVMEQIMDDLTASGVVVAISAGNSGAWAENAENGGYLYAGDVSQDTVGQPGSFTNSLAIASVENDGMVGYYLTVDGEMIVYNENLFNEQQPFTTIAGEHEYIFLDTVGKPEDWEAVADVLPGKIALCSRGETNFVDKAKLAVDAGAIGVLIYNNQSGMINLDLTEYTYTAPVAALSKVQGDRIRALSQAVTDEAGNVLYRTGTMTVSDSIGLGQFDSAYDTMSSFSSWGVPGSLEMKPEITAPGGNIYSLNGLEPGGKGYEIMSGTSMASPQVAGMAALMAQFVRETGLVEKTGMSERYLIQSLLMSTATPIQASEGVYYPILQQGAGLANVNDAMEADSYIAMAPGSSSGDQDGKVKVELFDDPDRTGSYTATFTVHNLQDEEKTLELRGDFFTQAVISDGEFDYMDYTTAMLAMDISWQVGKAKAKTLDMTGLDFNGDGAVNTADGQTLLDYATGIPTDLANADRADVDGDGDIDSHDAYVFLRDLTTATATLPAGGSVTLTANFSISKEARAALEESFPNGTYVQGFLFAQVVNGDGTDGTSHSIPVLGFYGNWTDPGMFDVGQWTTYATGEDTRIPYIGRTRGNDFKVVYDWDRGYSYSFGGNPLVPDSVYMPERDAMNSADSFEGISFIAIRHADQSRVIVKNETAGQTIMDLATGPVNMAYFYGALGWQNSGLHLTTNFPLDETAEGDRVSVSFTLIPEYYIDDEGMVDFDALGHGATLGTSFVIDNTAPELLGVSIDILTNTMTVKASDNQYVAAVGLYNKTGTRCLAQTGAKQDIQPGEEAEYSFSLDKVNGKKFLLQVFDYAMNTTTYLIEMQIGEETDLPEMMAYDLVSRHWAGFDKYFEYDYKEGTPRIAYSDHVIYAATIAEHYVFASTNKGELYVMPEDDLSDTTFIIDMETVLYDMAYNLADGEIYGVDEAGRLVKIHKLTGELTRLGQIGINTNTLACDSNGVFYCNELGTGKVYSFTLDTMSEPQLLMEDPFLTYVDPIAGADMGGTTGNMGMEYNPNTGKLCWNSHCEVLVGSYITYAYFYEIDPVTGEYTRYNDFWHEMSGLIIPDRTGNDNSWASPTDEVLGVKVNRSELEVIRNTTDKLIANVQPWTATDRTVTWSSSDESVATVDKYGVVTGHKEGTAIIRATSNLDPTMYGECTVNVVVLDVTVNGTLSDAEGQSMFYSWNMAGEDAWQAGATLPVTMTSATYSTLQDVFYMMDSDPQSFKMYKVDAEGNVLATAENTNGIALWDMAYSEYFSRLRDTEQVSSIYYTYLLSPKDPMDLDAVGFDLSSLANYLVGITSMGYEIASDEDGNTYETEHLVMLDSDGYVWHFWIYDREGGGMDALYAISGTNLSCEFLGDDAMDNMFTSLMVGRDGALYLSTFNGSTNELYRMVYDEVLEQYNAVLLGNMGQDVWPATITSVIVNGAAESASHPQPTGIMSSVELTGEDLQAAAIRGEHGDSGRELELKLNSLMPNADGSMSDPYILQIGDNSIESAQGTYGYAKFAPTGAGTATLTIGGTDWRYQFYHYAADGTELDNYSNSSKYDSGIITAELQAGDYIILGVTPYVSYTMPAGTVDVNLAYTGEGSAQPTDPTEPEDPTEPGGEQALVLGENSLTSGVEYTYTAAEDGRLEFDFTNVKDSAGSTIYQYAYGRGTRVKIMINGEYAAQLADTKITVSAGDTVTVELTSVDGDTYTATLTLTAVDPAVKLTQGENTIYRDTDYSYIAEKDGTLYTSIKELWCDGTYCTAASLSSSVVFKINGTTVYGFDNSYEVTAGDEITVSLGTQFGESANAVLYISYEGFYVHPQGSRGNPYILTYAQCPTQSVEIPAGSAVWYRLSGFGSGYNLVVTGENAYVIVGGTQINAAGGVVTVPAATNLQIGNAGSEAAAFTLSASVTEGYPDNPKDLAEGDNTATVEPSGNYYYDFVAPQDGTATATVSGDNWRFWYSHLAADGSAIVSEEDHRQAREDEDTITLDIKAGETMIFKLGTMTTSWTAPGGEITVTFHFEPDEPLPTDPEPTEPENPLVLGKNNLDSGVVYTYIATEDGRLEFAVNSVRNSAGSKLYSWTNGNNVLVTVDGVAMTKSSLRRNVTAGQAITVQLVPVDEDTYTAEMTLTALPAAQPMTLGENDIAQDLEHLYIAEQDGTMYVSMVKLMYNGLECSESALGSNVTFKINGSSVSAFNKSLEVKTGDELTVVIEDYSWDGSGTVSAVVNLSYEGFYEHPAGSIANPVKLMYADCPTETVEITAGNAAWYLLESYYDEDSWSNVYPFEDKYLVVTGENAYVMVGEVRHDAENGAVKVLMDDTTLIQIGNAGEANAVFALSVEIPEGNVENPKDLAEGDNKITLPSYSTYYYDFYATQDGTATVTVSGPNWRYNFAHYDADGNKLSGKDYYAKNGDADTVTQELKEGESIVVMVGTSQGYSQPGGDITVNFHFEPAQPEPTDPEPTDPEPTDPEPTDPEPTDPENVLVLGQNNLSSGVEYTYTATEDGRLEFAVNSVFDSTGSKLYTWTNGSRVQITIDGVAMTKSSQRCNVTAGQVITVQVVSVDGDTYTATMTLTALEAAQPMTLGENDIAQDLEHLYIAEQDGTLYVSVVKLMYNGLECSESVLGNNVLYKLNGSSVSVFNKSLEVKAGDEVTVIMEDYSWDGSGTVSAVVNLSYEGFYEHPAGSIANPVKLMYADCPTETIEIAAGNAAWYVLESYYDEDAWSDVYPFEDKYLVVTGENAYVMVGEVRHDAENGAVKVLMDDTTLIQIGNAGEAAAVYGLSVEIPEGHVENPKDLAEGDNKITLPSYSTYYYDFYATQDGTATVTVSGPNWRYNFAHYDADGNKLSGKDYYAKNGDADTVTQELKEGESIVVMVGTSQGYSQPGGDITVNFHFEPAQPEPTDPEPTDPEPTEPCTHENKETRNAKEATCTEEGYTGDIWCLDCGIMVSQGTAIPVKDHNYEDGICIDCGHEDPDAPNILRLTVTHEVDVTNGVTRITWDPAKLTLLRYNIHGDYTSLLEEEGSLTFGFVALRGIPTGESVAELCFRITDVENAVVTEEHLQINNDAFAGECEHTWSDWSENAQGLMERHCENCGLIQINPFIDVPVDSYFIDPVLWAVENGITTGTTPITFSPDDVCTRAQAVTFLWRAAGCPEPGTTENPFADVKEDSYYYKAVLWAVEEGITNGVAADSFAPNALCIRAQIVTFLWRAVGCPQSDVENPFVDVPADTYYTQAVLWAVEMGITTGITETVFQPSGACTRAQTVTFLYRLCA